MKIRFSILFSIFLSISILAQIPNGYYDDAFGLSGDDLMEALHNIIKDHTSVTYGSLWDHFAITDKSLTEKYGIFIPISLAVCRHTNTHFLLISAVIIIVKATVITESILSLKVGLEVMLTQCTPIFIICIQLMAMLTQNVATILMAR